MLLAQVVEPRPQRRARQWGWGAGETRVRASTTEVWRRYRSRYGDEQQARGQGAAPADLLEQAHNYRV